ncbi:PREDICTED: ejaculatory bulb-specific protein 3-like [Papilio xuthus]|uniref:Chemosensory protein n=1 Tax=Papilio xuthus TaxID=66420 RepID=A8QWR1_PAPXU|nr:PREDICTED: ejaculatory bulb-specific protein 3-like [Papilio xuthus]KPJ05758.1 Ejaculatory bulb-specific protein 3 [Papilio xuthus]BAF91721.1 chemosensory protein [Papilio xuthus]
MKLILMILASTIALVQGDATKQRYDAFDIQTALQNDDIILSLINCFGDTTPCSPEMKAFKNDIPTALQTACGKCSDRQREVIRHVIRTVMKKYPDAWTYLIDKYDPENKYRDGFYQFIGQDD